MEPRGIEPREGWCGKVANAGCAFALANRILAGIAKFIELLPKSGSRVVVASAFGKQCGNYPVTSLIDNALFKFVSRVSPYQYSIPFAKAINPCKWFRKLNTGGGLPLECATCC